MNAVVVVVVGLALVWACAMGAQALDNRITGWLRIRRRLKAIERLPRGGT